jgi:hypothetical protein
MAEQLDKTLINDEEAVSFNAPIPGESLTVSPETPNNWETPPRYVDDEKAMEELYLLMTEKERLTELVKIIDEKVPLDEIAQVILYKGYTEGQYNPDVMLLMIEPTLYLLIAIADYAGIKDYVLYAGEDDDPETEIPDDNVTPVNMDDDEDETDKQEEPKIVEPEEDVVGKSLLGRIKKELPSKVKEAVNIKEEVK